MDFTTGETWRDEFVTTAQASRECREAELYRRVRAGEFVRLATGVYMGAPRYSQLDVDEQCRARLHAVAMMSARDLIFCRASAAALWRLPMVGTAPMRADVMSHTDSAETLAHWTAHRSFGAFETDSIDGLLVTKLARTVADVARSLPLVQSVPMIDRAISPLGHNLSGVEGEQTTRGKIALIVEGGPIRNRRRALSAISLADGLSGSPGESLSRVTMHVLGVPKPQLQCKFDDFEGSMFADFWWPDFNVVGEFDGLGKYLRPEWAKLGPAEAVIREKHREDRIRALGPSVTRWGWKEARSPELLAAKLRRAGIRW